MSAPAADFGWRERIVWRLVAVWAALTRPFDIYDAAVIANRVQQRESR